jgi:hypothetical protein
MCCSASNCLHVFYCCFCCWVLFLMHCGQIECMVLFLFSYISWCLLCVLCYDQFWRGFHGLLGRIYIVLKLNEIFCRHQLGLFDVWCDLVIEFLYWFFVWITYVFVMGVLKSPTTTVLESIYVFRSFRVCLMKLGALMLGIFSLWCISPFISMECPLSCLISISLKSVLSEISIVTPACFQGLLGW